jgi:hypothetical protein
LRKESHGRGGDSPPLPAKVIGPKAVIASFEDGDFAIAETTADDGEPINDPLHPQS